MGILILLSNSTQNWQVRLRSLEIWKGAPMYLAGSVPHSGRMARYFSLGDDTRNLLLPQFINKTSMVNRFPSRDCFSSLSKNRLKKSFLIMVNTLRSKSHLDNLYKRPSLMDSTLFLMKSYNKVKKKSLDSSFTKCINAFSQRSRPSGEL